MTLIEQLNRLAEIAPEVCQKAGGPPDDSYKIGGYIFFASYEGDFVSTCKDHRGKKSNYTGRPALAWLRDALEQVVEARGWGWELRGFSPIGAIGWRYKVVLMIGQDSVIADSPAEALLAALIAALGEGER